MSEVGHRIGAVIALFIILKAFCVVNTAGVYLSSHQVRLPGQFLCANLFLRWTGKNILVKCSTYAT